MAVIKKGLGRGLDALLNDNAADGSGAVTVKLNDIEPNREQPRKDLMRMPFRSLHQASKSTDFCSPLL